MWRGGLAQATGHGGRVGREPQLGEQLQRARLAGHELQRLVQLARGVVHVEGVDGDRREGEQLLERPLGVARLDEHRLEGGVQRGGAGRALEPVAQRADRLRVEPHLAERLGVRDDLVELAIELRRLVGGGMLGRDPRVLVGRELDRVGVRDEGSLALRDATRRLLLGGRGGGRGAEGGADHALHRLVVRGAAREVLDEAPVDARLTLLVGEAGHLLVDLDRLARLTDGAERPRQQVERLEVLRVGLEADLQLREREHAVVGAAALEVERGRAARGVGVGAVVQQPLEHLERVVAAPEAQQHVDGGAEAGDRVADLADARVGLGEAQVREGVARVELDDLAVDLARFALLAQGDQARGDLVPRRGGVADELEVGVELRERGGDVRELLGAVGEVARHHLADLLVDGDRLEREALLGVEARDLLVGADRLGVGAHARLRVAELQQDARVVRVGGEELLELRDGLVVPLSLQVPLGGLQQFVAVNRHSRRTPARAVAA